LQGKLCDNKDMITYGLVKQNSAYARPYRSSYDSDARNVTVMAPKYPHEMSMGYPEPSQYAKRQVVDGMETKAVPAWRQYQEKKERDDLITKLVASMQFNASFGRQVIQPGQRPPGGGPPGGPGGGPPGPPNDSSSVASDQTAPFEFQNGSTPSLMGETVNTAQLIGSEYNDRLQELITMIEEEIKETKERVNELLATDPSVYYDAEGGIVPGVYTPPPKIVPGVYDPLQQGGRNPWASFENEMARLSRKGNRLEDAVKAARTSGRKSLLDQQLEIISISSMGSSEVEDYLKQVLAEERFNETLAQIMADQEKNKELRKIESVLQGSREDVRQIQNEREVKRLQQSVPSADIFDKDFREALREKKLQEIEELLSSRSASLSTGGSLYSPSSSASSESIPPQRRKKRKK